MSVIPVRPGDELKVALAARQCEIIIGQKASRYAGEATVIAALLRDIIRKLVADEIGIESGVPEDQADRMTTLFG